MTHTAEAGMNVRYYTACTGTTVQERKKCENLKVEDVVSFTISIEVTNFTSSFLLPKHVLDSFVTF